MLLEALPELAEHYQEWATDYTMDEKTAMWRHQGDSAELADRPLRLEVPD